LPAHVAQMSSAKDRAELPDWYVPALHMPADGLLTLIGDYADVQRLLHRPLVWPDQGLVASAARASEAFESWPGHPISGRRELCSKYPGDDRVSEHMRALRWLTDLSLIRLTLDGAIPIRQLASASAVDEANALERFASTGSVATVDQARLVRESVQYAQSCLQQERQRVARARGGSAPYAAWIETCAEHHVPCFRTTVGAGSECAGTVESLGTWCGLDETCIQAARARWFLDLLRRDREWALEHRASATVDDSRRFDRWRLLRNDGLEPIFTRQLRVFHGGAPGENEAERALALEAEVGISSAVAVRMEECADEHRWLRIVLTRAQPQPTTEPPVNVPLQQWGMPITPPLLILDSDPTAPPLTMTTELTHEWTTVPRLAFFDREDDLFDVARGDASWDAVFSDLRIGARRLVVRTYCGMLDVLVQDTGVVSGRRRVETQDIGARSRFAYREHLRQLARSMPPFPW